ncbi:adenylate kinase [Kurthia zopfii]|uniref:Adenylate kinase n=1 Tax=Kurthia zopfii TaxID=1650 RepID=A0A8B4Q495_9BACL|nr:adenylate kinase [Kurthia zopfii]PWI22360.1 adenylate kinase [Kurthia zopfii]TDR38324.1 hypothetical protein DFR61_11754 [Kurthia zopfii]GEK30645.1 adenylate kinase [Kurthia zopfii]STX08637.1 Uncharacterised protein [Kurthia zopfii]
MIHLITGASHSGKTLFAQKLIAKYQYSCISLDLLKMGLIRSKKTNLTPMDDEEIELYMWPIIREMMKTALENHQHLIIEGCYIPFGWEEDFSKEELQQIEYHCLVMSERYIRENFNLIKDFANVIEDRQDDSWCTMESVLENHAYYYTQCRAYNYPMIFIDERYPL